MDGGFVGKGSVKCEACTPLEIVEPVVRAFEGEAVADDANANRLATVIARRPQRLQHRRVEFPPFVEERDGSIVERRKEDGPVALLGGRRDNDNGQSGQRLATRSASAEMPDVVGAHEAGSFQDDLAGTLLVGLESVDRSSERPHDPRHQRDAANAPDGFLQKRPAGERVDHVPHPSVGSTGLGRDGRATWGCRSSIASRDRPLPYGAARPVRPRNDERDDE